MSSANTNKILSQIAKKLKLTAKENPILDAPSFPHPRHWAFLPQGLKLCFTLNTTLDEGPVWHLSISGPTGSLTDDELGNYISAFFDPSKPIKQFQGYFDKNIKHFFQAAEGINLH